MASTLPSPSSPPSAVLFNQLTWLMAKKTSYLSELQQFETKTQQKVNKLIQINNQMEAEKRALMDEVEEKRRIIGSMEQNSEMEIGRCREEIQRFAKEGSEMRRIIQLKQEEERRSREKLIARDRTIKELQSKANQLQSTLQLRAKQNESTVEQLTEINNKNVQKMISKYEQLITERVSAIEQKYQQELQQIKANNRTIVQELQQRSKSNVIASKDELKKNAEDTERLILQNKKLLFNVNEGKRKIMNLENQLESSRQENKIMGKEKQIQGINGKRELQCLRESKQGLEERVKKLQEQLDENRWEVKQMQIEKEKEIKKVKDQSEGIVDQLVTTYKAEISDFKLKIKQLKDQNSEVVRKYEDMKRERDSAREVTEFLKRQKEIANAQRLETQKKKNQHDISDQTQTLKLKSLNSELKKEILRKSAEIEVLKQEIARLKAKVNKITVAYQQNLKAQELVEKQNKMLLSQIVFLRDKNKSRLQTSHKKAQKQNRNGSRNSSRILDLQSEQSEIMDNENPKAELEMYKELIVEMEKDMNEAVAKLDQKNTIIDKQKAIIDRLERALNK